MLLWIKKCVFNLNQLPHYSFKTHFQLLSTHLFNALHFILKELTLLTRYHRPGMHNIQPAGQMWPAVASYLAHKAQNFILFACLHEKTPLEWVKAYVVTKLSILCSLLWRHFGWTIVNKPQMGILIKCVSIYC